MSATGPRLGGRNGRRTNVALLGLLPVSLATGALAFGLGTPLLATVVVAVHGAAGLGVALVSPWKSVVVRRGLRRARSGWQASVLLAVLIVVTLVTGVAHTAGVIRLPFGLTTMQVHVGAALMALPMAGWHALARPARPQRRDLSRRALLRTTGLAVGAGVAWAATEGALVLTGARGAQRRFTGSHQVRAGAPLPTTQWLFDQVPEVDAQAWRVRVGWPDSSRVLRPADLDRGEARRAVLDCTGGWYAEREWSGVRLDRLVGDHTGARSVVVRSVTGYARRYPLADLDRLWLATRCDGEPLSPGHGAPARLVAPGRRGFWWVKWVVAVELDDAPPWRQPPFPLS